MSLFEMMDLPSIEEVTFFYTSILDPLCMLWPIYSFSQWSIQSKICFIFEFILSILSILGS
jgi:hypothetical protein